MNKIRFTLVAELVEPAVDQWEHLVEPGFKGSTRSVQFPWHYVEDRDMADEWFNRVVEGLRVINESLEKEPVRARTLIQVFEKEWKKEKPSEPKGKDGCWEHPVG